ncbi:hypothetical protein N5923_22945 [Erwiniaceae bacterium BAC15a-03b]|uniref:Uncharacterized protein n=1 Tax=Winslowiella arboricola TaxID=2978220 RepID=A0A9J6PX97_9GAMM|nr:hypothetical protein [Winslowiella arboricola]MCU5775246.1 hypothetical protein [Winslowiella arboricola]MCU5780357.1 hypothetical protein [Winslowiella arboricola]
MLTKEFKARFQNCKSAEKSIKMATGKELSDIKEDLMDEMGLPIGKHTTGLPIVISMLFMILGFAMTQLSLWSTVLAWFSLPAYTVLAWVFAASFVFMVVNTAALFLAGKGVMKAVEVHIALALFTVFLCIIHLAKSITGFLSSEPSAGVHLLSAILGLVFISISFFCINSKTFYQMLVYTLHNRAWRKLLKTSQQGLKR